MFARLVAPLAGILRLTALTGVALATWSAEGACQARGVKLTVDTVEASLVLGLLEAGAADIPDADPRWTALFASEGYLRLKDRELGMKREFADSAFRSFVRSDSLRTRRVALRRTLDAWSRASVNGSAERALAYLPDEARLNATIYIVIKPRTNSFVWDVERNPAIFLYLNPDVTTAQLENTVAHELHHIGFASVRVQTDSIRAAIPDSARSAAEWMGALAEGFAMLAAAGGPSVHPHAVSPGEDRARWDKDMTRFNQDLRTLDHFFLDVLARRVAGDSVAKVAATFYGVQGPWYTVGWKMAVTIEQAFGRAELIQCMRDPRRLIERYNAAAERISRRTGIALARFSPALVTAIR